MRTLYLPLILVLLTLTSCFQLRTVSDKGRTTSPPPQSGPNKIQIALLLDTSGSMDDLLEHAKTEFWSVVEELMYQYDGQQPPQLEIALYEYGNKSIGQNQDYVRQVVPLTSELDWIADELWQLDSRGRKEYVGLAIERATRELNWSRNARDIKMIFVAGNQSFQKGPVNPYRAIEMACGRDIEVHTLFAGSFNDGIAMGWREGANSCGTYAAMDFAQPYNPYNTRYDRQICDLNGYYNQTYLPYGAYGATYYDRCIRQDQYFQSYGNSWYAGRTFIKTGPFYFNPRWDLVDAIGCGQVRLEDLPRNQWPQSMQGMSIRQANDFVANKSREREQLNRKIKDLHAQRRGAIRQANPGSQSTRSEFGSFNAAVAGTIRQPGNSTTSGRREITRTPSSSRTPAETRPTRTTAPTRTSPSRTSPAETRPSRTTPTRTSPSRTSPAETRPSRTTPTRTSPSRTSPAETRPSRTTPTRTSPSRTSPAETRPTRTTPTRTNPVEIDRQAEERRDAQVQQERREVEARRQTEQRREAQVQQERRETEARRQTEQRREAQVKQERREAEASRQAEDRREAQVQQQRREAEASRQAEDRREAQVQQQRREAEASRQAEQRREAQVQQQRREAAASRQAEQRREAQAQKQSREAEARQKAQKPKPAETRRSNPPVKGRVIKR